VASITDAAGVATKALFSFASTLPKSVLDIAQTSMAHVPATGGSVKVGATAQVGDKQVLYAMKHLLCQSSQAVRLRAYRPLVDM